MNKIITLLAFTNAFAFNNVNEVKKPILTYMEYDLENVSHVDPRLVINEYESNEDIKFEYRIDNNMWEEYSSDKEFEGENIQFRVLEKQVSSTVNISNQKCSLANGDSFIIGSSTDLILTDMTLNRSYPVRYTFSEARCSIDKTTRWYVTYEPAYDYVAVENKCDLDKGSRCLSYKRDTDGQWVYVYPSFVDDFLNLRTFYFNDFLKGSGIVTQSFDIYKYEEIYISKWLNIDISEAIELKYELNKYMENDEVIESICDDNKCLGIEKGVFLENLNIQINGNELIFKTKTNNLKDAVITFNMPEPILETLNESKPIVDAFDVQTAVICLFSALLITLILIYMYKRWNK